MVASNREFYPIERNDEIRALAPHLTYAGLTRWFQALLVNTTDTPTTRHHISTNNTAYNVTYRHAVVWQNFAGVTMQHTDTPGTRVLVRARREQAISQDTHLPYAERYRNMKEIDLLTTHDLAWRQEPGAKLDLVARGVQYRKPYTLAIATVITRGPLDVVTAEQLFLDAAPHDPLLA